MHIDDLRETAALAHLNLDEAELAAAFPAFEQMIGFFAAMQAADEDAEAFSPPISGLSPSARTVPSSHLRQDHAVPRVDGETGALVDKAGGTDGRFIVVPNVL
ncbi:MAG: aspartyl/glutamyl-tRNA amidotransferase subunit C [Treponema sp.]|jgi:aspartyl-tRNA(Asn)/glutamyl-tRNA(Gln) amidotransferase subunit C|nr:aspartyl/glutamyl-tRNA amidotransferase subunit C [Treponema sp.]